MSRVSAVATVALALAAIAAPIYLSIELARRQGLRAESKLALSVAKDAQQRADTVGAQVFEATERLRSLTSEPPCGPQHLAAMGHVDLASSYVQAIGHVSGNGFDCSSLGPVEGGIELGPVDFTTDLGLRVRRNVVLPFAPDRPMLVLEREGYAAVIHKALPLDVGGGDSEMAIAQFSLGQATALTERGRLEPGWAKAPFEGGNRTYVDGEHVVAAVRSTRYATGTVVALPLARATEAARSFALLLVPIGCIAGLALAFAVLRLARLQHAMPHVIRAALKRNEFFLVYQPVVDLQSGEWIGAEALLRWRRTSGEMMRPDVFIPIAEDSGLIQRITAKVLEIVGKEAGQLVSEHPDFHLAINLSSADLGSRDSVGLLCDLAKKPGFRACNLIVEATERGFLRADVAMGVVKELRQQAFRVAIDDFGTGYSSLAYLQTFEIDYLKIDKSFVDTVGKEAATSQVVQHIIAMAQSLGLQMIAEGVETEAQAAFLRARGVQFAQGWLFAKPMPLKDILAKLRGTRASRAPSVRTRAADQASPA